MPGLAGQVQAEVLRGGDFAENSGLALLEGAADRRNTLLSLSASRPLHPPRVPKEMAESEGRKILCVSERGKGYGSVVLW